MWSLTSEWLVSQTELWTPTLYPSESSSPEGNNNSSKSVALTVVIFLAVSLVVSILWALWCYHKYIKKGRLHDGRGLEELVDQDGLNGYEQCPQTD